MGTFIQGIHYASLLAIVTALMNKIRPQLNYLQADNPVDLTQCTSESKP